MPTSVARSQTMMKLRCILALLAVAPVVSFIPPSLSGIHVAERGIVRNIYSRWHSNSRSAASQILAPDQLRCIIQSRSRNLYAGILAATSSLQSSSSCGWPLPEKLLELAGSVGRSADEKQASLRLIEMGDDMASRLGEKVPFALEQRAIRVPGCVSVVSVAVEVSKDSGRPGSSLPVSIRGSADARVARGLLALLVDGLEGQPAEVVLGIDAADIIEAARIKSLLPAGRNNGMANMLKVVQDQVRQLVQGTALPSDSDVKLGGADADAEGWKTAKGKVELLGNVDGYWGIDSSEEVAVLLSGGVDSSVALKLCQEQGLKTRAFYLKIWLEDELAHLGECPWEEDWNYAKGVADQLNVPLEAVSLQREYWDQVVSYLIQEAREGRTPNPDIMCNSRIKFGMFYDYVGKHFGHLATGHYAQVEKGPNGLVRLIKSPDTVKDQTYFLSNLKQSQLTNAMFPIGGFQKRRVRELAQEFNLPTQARKDSQGICFLGKLKFEDFVGHHLGENRGIVKDFHTGAELGEHQGLWFHTVGQRKGLGEATKRHVHDGPWYVAAKNADSNILYVSNKYDTIEAERSNFEVENINWIPGPCPAGESMELDIKIRHGAGIHAARVDFLREGRARVALQDRDSGLAAGQFAAFYRGDECLGAGSISDATFLPEGS